MMSKSPAKKSEAIRWTAQQREAIVHEGSSVMVSAAAGAGKTEVLARHCAQLVAKSDPACGINELLVVTFTEPAAAEMRERIGRIMGELSDQQPGDEHLAREAARVSTAAISTIHSFCQTVLRQNFARAGLDPQFKIIDPDEALLLKRACLDEVFEELYLDQGKDGEVFRALVDLYGSGEDLRLGELVMRLSNFLGSLVGPEEWLNAARQWLEPVKGKPSEEMLRAYGELLTEKFKQRISLCRHNAQKIVELLELPELKNLGLERYAKLLEFQKKAQEISDGWQELIGVVKKGAFDELAGRIGKLIVRQPSPPRPKEEAARAAIGRIKECFKQVASRKSCQGILELVGMSLAEQGKALEQSAAYGRMILELAQRLAGRYSLAKQAQDRLDFNDLERKCLDLLNEGTAERLEPSAVARQLQNRFGYVLVDEYQDINPLQNAILRLVSREIDAQRTDNLFAVGDIKQSIYRFRLAEPGIFLERLDRAKDGTGGQVIDLQSNFRSREGIIEAVNLIFERLMQAELGNITYDEHARLKLGLRDYEKVDAKAERSFGGAAVEVHLLCKGKSDDTEQLTPAEDPGDGEAALDQIKREAVLAGRRILDLLGRGESAQPMQVLSKDRGDHGPSLRDIGYGDIAILLRVTSNQAQNFARVLREMDIPVYTEAEKGYFASTEIQDMLALLEVLDNPLQDIPLAAVLRSPLGGFTASDLARIRLTDKDAAFHKAALELSKSGADELAERLGEFFEKLLRWRRLVRDEPLAEAIWQIYQDSSYLHYVAGLSGGRGRQANLLKLHDRARQFGTFARTGLGRFLQFLRNLQEREQDLGMAPGISEAEDVVRIISVHKSKGLEFPVVIIPRLSRQFNFRDSRERIIIDRQRYLGMHWVDGDRRESFATLGHLLAKENIERHVRAEEMRLLYVGLTRAREHLILIGSGTAKQLEPFVPGAEQADLTGSERPQAFELAGKRSWLDWLVPTLASLKPGQLEFLGDDQHPRITTGRARFVVSVYEPGRFRENIFAARAGKHHRRDGLTLGQIANLEQPKKPVEVGRELAQALELMDKQYRYAKLTEVPAVVSGSERKGLFEPTADEDLEPVGEFIGRSGAVAELGDLLGQKAEGLSSAQIGSLNHLFMQKVDLGRPCDALDLGEQANEMVRAGVLEKESLEVLDIQGAASFFATELGQAIRAEPTAVYRELPFVLAIEPRELAEGVRADGPEDKPIVRGIIDLLMVEDGRATIVDFKTDQVSTAELPARAKSYRWQLQMYGQAVGEILGLTEVRKVLYFLSARQLVQVN